MKANLNLNLQRIVKVREDERENLRRELRRSREKLHAMDNKAQREENLVTSTSNIHTQTEIGELIFLKGILI